MPPGSPHGSGTSRALRAEAFARLFEAVHEGVYIGTVEPTGSRTLSANSHLKLMFGYPSEVPDEAVRPFDTSCFVDPQARLALLDRLDRDGAVSDYLLRVRRADGRPIWVEVTAHVDARPSDAIFRIGALMRDVSERKNLEDRARDREHQLRQTEKLAAIGQTTSGVAHELNNPLATILTSAERLASSSVDDATRDGLDTILRESERAARIVRRLLTFARQQPTTRAMVELNQVVRETLSLRAYEQRVTNITVIPALAAGLPRLFADSHQLQQVLLNLIINAEQAMQSANGRGVLVVRTWHDPEREVVVVEVSDDGPGVADAVQNKVYDPFFTTKDVGKGTGLGLSVSYGIVQQHGGRITLKSTPGVGACFQVELPARTGDWRIRTPIPAGSASSATTDGARVLLVEDEAALATAVAEGLTDAGYFVDRAGDGEEALELVGREHYDVIVCDLKMPRLDGAAFYRAIAATAPELARRVIFVTGDVLGSDAERFLEDSGCRLLAKPFRLRDLLRATREVLG